MLELKWHNHNDYPLVYKIGRAVNNKFWEDFRVQKVLRISFNTGTCALPDMSTLALRPCMPLGIMCTYQAMYLCLCYNNYIMHVWTSIPVATLHLLLGMVTGCFIKIVRPSIRLRLAMPLCKLLFAFDISEFTYTVNIILLEFVDQRNYLDLCLHK